MKIIRSPFGVEPNFGREVIQALVLGVNNPIFPRISSTGEREF